MGMAQRHPNVTDIVDSEFRYFPGIAEAWAIDRESATIYVRIDPAARFSDGEPITTDDVLFTFFLLQNPHVNAPFAQNYINRNFTRITVYDAHTWSATLPESKPYMASRALSFEPWPEHVFPVVDESFLDRYQWTYVPSSGPYTIREEDIRKGRSVTLTRIDDWWAKDRKFWRNRYNFDRITLTVVRDAAKRFEAFRKGEVDATSLTLPEYWYDKLPDSDPLVQGGYVRKAVFYDDKPRPNYALWMNSSRPLLENRDIRIGIQHATNWRKVIEEYFRGDYTRMRTSSDGYGEFTHPTLQPRDFDVDAALEAFARAGFTERGPDGILVNDAGQRLSFTLSTGYDAMRDVLTILREEALAAGLEFRIEVLDSTAAWKKVQERQHDIHFVAFAQSAEMYPRYWENLHSVNAYDRAFLPDGSPNPDRVVKTQTNNLTVTADPEIDALIERYRASADAAEMIGLAHRLEEMIHEDASYMPAFAIPFYRIAYWRWLRFPDDMDVKITPSFPSPGYLLGWIEPGAREETEAARAAGETFEPVIEVYDQYRPD
ncbi:MAG: extracellular solute-binding protein, partial [Pseudomonadales bacterium]|jgi:microcin C transport system substrate-binding protein|nr:extracellular solute-binding protein [Pseudomonadales bacterium]